MLATGRACKTGEVLPSAETQGEQCGGVDSVHPLEAKAVEDGLAANKAGLVPDNVYRDVDRLSLITRSRCNSCPHHFRTLFKGTI